MTEKITLDIPLNRVEGDLEVRAELDGGVVSEAWCCGAMYRGFENILVGRGTLDGLVITPRICGICSTSHLVAATRALDMITSAQVPPNAIMARNLSLMAETVQSDARHAILMFSQDYRNAAYEKNPLFAEAQRRYEPNRGEIFIEAVRETQRLLDIIAIFGGKWPHSSFMVPGGIVGLPTRAEIMQCRHRLTRYREWYERRVLGCEIQRWAEVRSAKDLEVWLSEAPSHAESEVGFFLRFAKEAGLGAAGGGAGRFLSFGSLPIPGGSSVRERKREGNFVPAGFAKKAAVSAFEQGRVSEHVAHSWFHPQEGGKHPFEGETKPYATGNEGKAYSWAKAPRYENLSAETGPLAEAVVAKNPLFLDLVKEGGASTVARHLARLVRAAEFLPAMEIWAGELSPEEPFYQAPSSAGDGEGYGLIQAPRGALGHWVKIRDERIEHYQIITPSGWNFSPRDSEGARGPVEEALVGTPVKDPANPVELEHIIRSFDPCLVCTVHTLAKAGGSPRQRVPSSP